MRRFSSFIAESADDHHVAMAAGRFTGVTKEHHKLLKNLFSQKAHKHYVFVMGPESHEHTTAKDPFTVHEKIQHLKKLYPEHKDSFVPGTSAHTKTPNQAMAYAYHQNKDKAKNIHLTVVAGSGDAGVTKKSAAGGSADSYKEILHKYNKTKFPVRQTEDGKTVGGDYRMNYKSTHVVENPRGNVSGSVVRKFATDHDHTNPDHVKEFKKLLHPDTSHEDAAHMMKTIKERSQK